MAQREFSKGEALLRLTEAALRGLCANPSVTSRGAYQLGQEAALAAKGALDGVVIPFEKEE